MKRLTAFACILLGCLQVSYSFAATGPVSAASLPGSVSVVDSDPGAGESWGRPGGRDYSYSGFDPALFDLLEWQSLFAGMSFDGPIDTGDEVMALASLGLTVIVYTGSTQVQLPSGLTPVETRMTVTLSGATFIPSTTRVNVLADGDFSVNVLFEAKTPSSAWTPALTLFDSLPTSPPPAEELANTSFAQGFFFDADDLSVAEHDDNMQDRADQIVGLINFLTLEEAGHFADLGQAHDDLAAALATLQNTANMGPQLLSAISQQLDSQQQELFGVILCIWVEYGCPPQAPPGAPSLASMAMDLGELLAGMDWAKEDIGTILENLTSIIEHLEANVVPTEIDLEVITTGNASGNSRMFLVLSKVHGVPTTATLSATAAPTSGQSGYSLTPVASTSVVLAPGVQQLTLNLPGNLSSTKAFLINAERVGPDNSMQFGSTLTSTEDVAD